MAESTGLAGRIAAKMIDSPLVPIILAAALLMGAFGLLSTPREDRPEIEVPSAVIIIPFPGGGPELIDELVARPVSSWALQLARVKEVRSVASHDAALIGVEFIPGVSDADAYSELSDLVAANQDRLPRGAGPPDIRTIGDERLATLMITLSGPDTTGSDFTGFELRKIAEEASVRLEEVPNVRSIDIYGGEPRQITVQPNLQALAAYEIPIVDLEEALGASSLRLPGDRLRGDITMELDAGAVFRSVDDIRRIHVGAGPAGLVYLDDVAEISDGPAPAESHALFRKNGSSMEMPAVSLAVTTVPGKNISDINKAVLGRLDALHGNVIPSDVHVHIGYDAGRIATEQVLSVLRNLLTGTVVVIFIILAGLGRRAAIAISIMMPASLAFVPFVYYWFGFTLNPVSLSAMILAIGIISDDSVIMLENTARHFRQSGKRSRTLTIRAIDEVGNPTILAVLLIIATIVPTGFLSGEMGQFVRAIPVGAATAIFASLCLALTVIPYLAFRLLPAGNGEKNADNAAGEAEDAGAPAIPSGRLAGMYRVVLRPFMKYPVLRWLLYAILLLLFALALCLVYFRWVQIGLTPRLDREVFVLELRLPAGTPLEKTLEATSGIGRELNRKPEVAGYSIFAGTSGPALYPPPEPPEIAPVSTNQAFVYVHLTHEDDRKRKSFEITEDLYNILGPIVDRHDARMTIRNLPSGPAKKEDVHAGIYGPSEAGRHELAGRISGILKDHPATLSTRISPEDPAPRLSVLVDRTDAAAHGIFPAEAAYAVRLVLAGSSPAVMHLPEPRNPVPVVLRLAPGERELVSQLGGLYLKGAAGDKMVSLADLADIREVEKRYDRHRRNNLPVVYVAAKLDRTESEPFVAQKDISDMLAGNDRLSPDVRWFGKPANSGDYVLHWGGEWEMTRQTYGDLGYAGIVVIILIYSILAAWFGSYGIPLLIMMPIPLIFIGVLPAHWLFGQNVTGVGIMGVIALAGIVARNSVLLVDFIRQNRNQGMPLTDAVIAAGALRTRPIILTASTVMLGSGVLIFEPALMPLGLTLVSGVLVSTMLTLLVIPVLYYHCYKENEAGRGE